MQRIFKDYHQCKQDELVAKGMIIYVMVSSKTPQMIKKQLEKRRQKQTHGTHYYLNREIIYRAQNINCVHPHRCQAKTGSAMISYTVCHLTSDTVAEQQQNLKVLFQQIAEDARRLGIAITPSTIFFENDSVCVPEIIACIEAEQHNQIGVMSELRVPIQVGDVVRVKHAYISWSNGKGISEEEQSQSYKIIQKKTATGIADERLFLLDRIYQWVKETDIQKTTY